MLHDCLNWKRCISWDKPIVTPMSSSTTEPLSKTCSPLKCLAQILIYVFLKLEKGGANRLSCSGFRGWITLFVPLFSACQHRSVRGMVWTGNFPEPWSLLTCGVEGQPVNTRLKLFSAWPTKNDAVRCEEYPCLPGFLLDHCHCYTTRLRGLRTFQCAGVWFTTPAMGGAKAGRSSGTFQCWGFSWLLKVINFKVH